MEIFKIKIGGQREEIDRDTKEHTPNLIETVKRNELIFTPDQLLKKHWKGTSSEYDTWLMTKKIHPSNINFDDINAKDALIFKLKVYAARLLDEAKTESRFENELGNVVVKKWAETFDTLETHVYNLSDFNEVDFIKISDAFKKNFTTNSPFAFMNIDKQNQLIRVVASHKTLFKSDNPLPMGNKRGTAIGEEEKLYKNFFSTIDYKGKGELTEGLNHHRTNFKNFNFNLNQEVRLLNDTIYNELNLKRDETQVAYTFGEYGKKLYFESDIKGTERRAEEVEALKIVEGVPANIEKEIHKERQGSIAVNQTTAEVLSRENINMKPTFVTNQANVDKTKEEVIEVKKETFVSEDTIQKNEVADRDNNNPQSVSSTLDAYMREISIKQQGYAELAKQKIDEALVNREQYVKEFYSFLDKGLTINDALSKFTERYVSNPYIKGIIETSITAELTLSSLKDKGIEELLHNVDVLKSDKQGLEKDLGAKEDVVADLNQKITSMQVEHTKQLGEIETKVVVLVEEKENYKSLNIELEALLNKYETTLKAKEEELGVKEQQVSSLVQEAQQSKSKYETTLNTKEEELGAKEQQISSLVQEAQQAKSKYETTLKAKEQQVSSLGNEKQKMTYIVDSLNSKLELEGEKIKGLSSQLDISKETITMVKGTNEELSKQLSELKEKRVLLESRNSELEKINNGLDIEKSRLQQELKSNNEPEEKKESDLELFRAQRN